MYRLSGAQNIKELCIIFLLIGCASSDGNRYNDDHPLIGTWTYYDCNIKNTSVKGTIEFKTNGTFELNIRARDDYPMEDNLRGKYRYSVKGNRIETEYKGGYGMDSYFIIEGEYLYLSGHPIDRVITEPARRAGNWSHRLKRGMDVLRID